MNILGNKLIIKDIFDYESLNDVNILEDLQYGTLSTLIDIIALSHDCSEDNAIEIFEQASKEMKFTEIIEQVLKDLIGRLPSDDSEENIEDVDTSFSDILEKFYTEIQTIDNNLSIGEFLQFTPRYIYTYADGLQKRFIYNKNKQYLESFENAAIIISGLAGKLKEPPQLNENGTLKKASIRDKIAAIKLQGSVR